MLTSPPVVWRAGKERYVRKPVVVAERAEGRDNNFNLLRMIAASAVLVSHAYPLTLGKDAIEPLLTSTGYKLGTTAVTIFFAVSGFFITKSFDRRNSIPDFLLARVARIYPALIVVLMLSAFVLGPIMTALPVGQYFSSLHTWTYVPRNLMLRHQQWALPGIFLTAPGGAAVNGSLWTLFAEVSCYALVMLFALLRLTRPLSYPLILCLAIALILLVPQTEGGGLAHAASTLSFPFALGAAAYVYRQYVPVSGLLALALLGLAALCRWTPAYPILHALAISYGALWFGFANIPGLRAYNRLGDYSYGMYIYAFPVEQVIATTLHPASPWVMIAIGFPITLALAVVSWTWIEAPALANRHVLAAQWRLRRLRAREAAAAAAS
jgi:peptidoglycan/LPS O-acetylase OafA/YrhL